MDEIQFLRELLSIPSVNGTDDEGIMAEYLHTYFKACGLTSRLERIDDYHANVIAWMNGVDTCHTIIWNGHLDTVPYGNINKWTVNPAIPTLRAGFIYGRGASDMKSGLAAMAWVLGKMKKRGVLPVCNICFIGTCDEECGGIGAEACLKKDILEKAEAIIIGEPTGCNLGLAQKGCVWLEIEGTGKASHSAYPEEGWNAVDSCMAVAGQITRKVRENTHPLLGQATAQITQIEGGAAPNMTPDYCRLMMDIRLTPGIDKETILAYAVKAGQWEQQISKNQCHISFQVKNDRKTIELPSSHPLPSAFRKVIQGKGREAIDMGVRYFTDASIFCRKIPDVPVLLFGPGNPKLAHQPDERVALHDYTDAIEIMYQLFARTYKG